jgi:predicted ArsR family transcriptional regulator
MTERLKVKGGLKERIRALVDLLTNEGYFVRYEERDEGFVLSFSNCPIAQVAKRFQEACVSEEEVFERILGVPVVQQCRQALGDICCRYFVVKSREKERV